MKASDTLSYLEYNNPVHITWRKGSPEDPFIDRLDVMKVVNQRIALSEIPDSFYGVRLQGYNELTQDDMIKNGLGDNDYYVDYSNGFVFVNPSKEAQTLSLYYKGRGLILYPDTRIVHYNGENSYETLHEIIIKSQSQIENLINATEDFEAVLEKMVTATNLTELATNESKRVTEEAKDTIKKSKEAYESTFLIYKEFVDKYEDLATEYPNPEVGWTVQVYENGVRYRWNGAEWTAIDSFGGNIALANENLDGLLSKEGYSKLTDISEFVDTRILVFVVPQELLDGTQDVYTQFPFEGEIIHIDAMVSRPSTTNTKITVETSKNFQTWESVTSNPLVILAEQYRDNQATNIFKKQVASNQIFRLKVEGADGNIKNLSVNIKINIK